MSEPRQTQILENWNTNGIPTGVPSPNNYNNDSFGRARVGIPSTQYEYSFQYNKAPIIWDERITGSGSSTHVQLESSVALNTGSTTDTNGITRQTFQYFRYRPGKSLEFQETFVFNVITTNVIKRVGYFDDLNGVYFEQDGENDVYKIVKRSYVTGSVVNTEIAQSNWNVDTLDGSGRSGITADFTKVQILSVNLQWLGVGSIVCGFVINRTFYPVHIFNHANTIDTVYMTTANLPLRYEIFNRGTAGAPDTMKQICSTVITNGGVDEEVSYIHSVQNVAIKASIGTTFTNLINIRPKATFNSIVNRGQILPASIEINNTGTGTLLYELVYNATIAGTPAYNSAGANSITEFDIAGTTISGGEIIDSGQVISSNQVKSGQKSSIGVKYPIALDIDGANPKNLVLAVRALTGTVDAVGSITFAENY
jgi:hypothetical protein